MPKLMKKGENRNMLTKMGIWKGYEKHRRKNIAEESKRRRKKNYARRCRKTSHKKHPFFRYLNFEIEIITHWNLIKHLWYTLKKWIVEINHIMPCLRFHNHKNNAMKKMMLFVCPRADIWMHNSY